MKEFSLNGGLCWVHHYFLLKNEAFHVFCIQVLFIPRATGVFTEGWGQKYDQFRDGRHWLCFIALQDVMFAAEKEQLQGGKNKLTHFHSLSHLVLHPALLLLRQKKKNVHGFFTFQICFAIIWFGARELHWSAGAQMFNAADRSGGGCMFSHLSHH